MYAVCGETDDDDVTTCYTCLDFLACNPEKVKKALDKEGPWQKKNYH
jgi:hypothetical protein